MLTGRGWAVGGGAAVLWVAARMLGSPGIHASAVGLLALLAFAAAAARWRRQVLASTRRLSSRRVFPGTKVRVDLEIRNDGGARAPVLLLEDRLPAALGRAARAVMTDVPAKGRRSVTYTLTARGRGRYRIGPLAVHLTDPFDLARRRVEIPGYQELIVYPEVEDLSGTRSSGPGIGSGESASRQLFRTGDDFYTMRPYEIGDDLRRIHWRSTARTGSLMIRQDEASRRASVTVFLDTRGSGAGGRSAVFEKAVSAAASVGTHFVRAGFDLRLATPDLAPQRTSLEELLGILAVVTPSRARLLAPSLSRLRGAGGGGATLVMVTHLPLPDEVEALSRTAAEQGPRLAVLVTPEDAAALSPLRRSEMEAWAQGVRAGLGRAGWDVIVIAPSDRLGDAWHERRARQRAAAGSW